MTCKKLIAMLVCLLLITALIPTEVQATEAVNLQRNVSLTISYRSDGRGVAGIPFEIYRVADVSANMDFALTGEFASYPITFRGLDSEGWGALAQTLAGYISRDAIRPMDSGATDSQGRLSFPKSGTSMMPGLYLLVSTPTDVDGYRYTTSPTLLCLPTAQDDGTLNYNVTIEPKFTKDPTPSNTIVRKVLKVWDDKSHENARPSSITVQLLRDGAVYDTVTLNAANQWRHTWLELSPEHNWQVTEKDVKDYTCLVHQDGITFVITNTYKPTTPTTPTTPTKPILPQTGTTWYLVPILICAGLACLAIGLWRRKSEE